MIVIDPKNPKGIVWVASYPKSGNTWIRAFLFGLYRVMRGDPPSAIDVNKMDDFTRSESDAAQYLKYLTGPVTEVDRREIAAARPQVQSEIVQRSSGMVLVKTHNALISDRGAPLINQAVSAGAVYVVRNPLDVAVSFSHFLGISIAEAIKDMATEGFGLGTDEKRVYSVMGTWSVNVSSWTERAPPAVLAVRYEDMLDKPIETFGLIANHLLMRPTTEQLTQAIELSSFERLQKAEMTAGYYDRGPATERFFREGRANQWRDVLNAADVDRIVAAHGAQMRRFGYLP